MSGYAAGGGEPGRAPIAAADLELLRARAARYAKTVEVASGHVTDVVCFARCGSRYAIPLESLREIRPLRQLCAIPGASARVPGVFHSRGEIVSVHDVEVFLGGSPRSAPGWVIMVEHDRERLGLMADEVLGVEQANASAVGPVPISLGPSGSCFLGVLGAETLLLSPSRLFTTPEFFSAF